MRIKRRIERIKRIDITRTLGVNEKTKKRERATNSFSPREMPLISQILITILRLWEGAERREIINTLPEPQK